MTRIQNGADIHESPIRKLDLIKLGALMAKFATRIKESTPVPPDWTGVLDVRTSRSVSSIPCVL